MTIQYNEICIDINYINDLIVGGIQMRILICDDDAIIAEQLKKYLHEYFDRCKFKCPDITIFNDGESLLQDSGDKDIVFLDIEMPGLNGIYVGNELKKLNKNVIVFIVTSYVEYLDDAMRFHVFRYLSKPLERQRLFRNMKDAMQLYNASVTKIPIETKQEVYTVLAADIIMIEAQGRNVFVHTVTDDYKSVHPLQYWIQALLKMNCFFQTHRSFIVNLAHVSDFDHSLIHLCHNQFEAYLTRRKYSLFKEAFLLYLESTR